MSNLPQKQKGIVCAKMGKSRRTGIEEDDEAQAIGNKGPEPKQCKLTINNGNANVNEQKGRNEISNEKKATMRGNLRKEKSTHQTIRKVHWPEEAYDMVDCRIFDVDDDPNDQKGEEVGDNQHGFYGEIVAGQRQQLSGNDMRRIDSQRERERREDFLMQQQQQRGGVWDQSINMEREEDLDRPQRLEWRLIPIEFNEGDWPSGLPIEPGKNSETKIVEERRWTFNRPKRRSELLETGDENNTFNPDHEIKIIPLERMEEEADDEEDESGEGDEEEEVGDNGNVEEEEGMEEDEMGNKENEGNDGERQMEEEVNDGEMEEEEYAGMNYIQSGSQEMEGNEIGVSRMQERIGYNFELDQNPSCSSDPPRMPSSQQIQKEMRKVDQNREELERRILELLEKGDRKTIKRELTKFAAAMHSDEEGGMDDESEQNDEEEDKTNAVAQNETNSSRNIVENVLEKEIDEGEIVGKERQKNNRGDEKKAEGGEELSEHTVQENLNGNAQKEGENPEEAQNEWTSIFANCEDEEEENNNENERQNEQDRVNQIGGLRLEGKKSKLPIIKIDPDEELEEMRKEKGDEKEVEESRQSTEMQQKRKEAAEEFLRLQNYANAKEQSSSILNQSNCAQNEKNEDENERTNRQKKKNKKEKRKREYRKYHSSPESSPPPATRSRHSHLADAAPTPNLHNEGGLNPNVEISALVERGPRCKFYLPELPNFSCVEREDCLFYHDRSHPTKCSEIQRIGRKGDGTDIPNYNCLHHFGLGHCKNGANCQFLHGDIPTVGSRQYLKDNPRLIRNELSPIRTSPVPAASLIDLSRSPIPTPIPHRIKIKIPLIPPPPFKNPLEISPRREPSILSVSSSSKTSPRDRDHRRRPHRSGRSHSRSRPSTSSYSHRRHSRSPSTSPHRSHNHRSRSRSRDRHRENRNRSRSRTRIIIEISDDEDNSNENFHGAPPEPQKYGRELPSQHSEFLRSRSRSRSRPCPLRSDPVMEFNSPCIPIPPDSNAGQFLGMQPMPTTPHKMQLPRNHVSFTRTELLQLVEDCPHYVLKGWCRFALNCRYSHGDQSPTIGYRNAERVFMLANSTSRDIIELERQRARSRSRSRARSRSRGAH